MSVRAAMIGTLVNWTHNEVSDEVYVAADEAAISILVGLGYAPGDLDRHGVEVADEVQSLLVVALARLQLPPTASITF